MSGGSWQELQLMFQALREDDGDPPAAWRPDVTSLALVLHDLRQRLGRAEQLMEALAADLGGERCKIVLARREQTMPKKPAGTGSQP